MNKKSKFDGNNETSKTIRKLFVSRNYNRDIFTAIDCYRNKTFVQPNKSEGNEKNFFVKGKLKETKFLVRKTKITTILSIWERPGILQLVIVPALEH